MPDINSNYSAPNVVMTTQPGYRWDVEGATGVFWLGAPLLGTPPNSGAVRNMVSRNSAPASVVGTPTEHDSYLTLGGSTFARLATDIPETPSMTVVAAVRCIVEAGGASVPLGNYQNAQAVRGMQCVVMRDASGIEGMRFFCGFNNAGSYADQARTHGGIGDTTSRWRLLSWVVEEGVGVRMADRTGGTQASFPDTRARWIATGRPLNIGVGGWSGAIDVAFAGVVPRAMSDAEIDRAVAKPRLYLNERWSMGV